MLGRGPLEIGPGALKKSIDDDFGTLERGFGGATHLRNMIWATPPPILHIAAEDEQARTAC